MTLDVKSLYTNTHGIQACREALKAKPQLQPPTGDLIELAQQILTKNTFTFADKFYLQKHGRAMGTRMAPSYANLFMGKLGKDILATARNSPLVWWRFIDDIFAIWTHGESSLREFLSHINQAHPTIKFIAGCVLLGHTGVWENLNGPLQQAH